MNSYEQQNEVEIKEWKGWKGPFMRAYAAAENLNCFPQIKLSVSANTLYYSALTSETQTFEL